MNPDFDFENISEIERFKLINLQSLKDFVEGKSLESLKNYAIKAKKHKFYFFHHLLSILDANHLEVVLNNVRNLKLHYKNDENQDWLHIVLKSKNENLFIKLKDYFTNYSEEDRYGYNYCHYAFQFDTEFIKKNYQYFVRSLDILMKPAGDGFTPIERICDNFELLNDIMKYLKKDYTTLIKRIDNVQHGIICTEYDNNYEWRIDWIKLLAKYDRYKLLSLIKMDKFHDDLQCIKDVEEYIYKCPENGLGILSYFRDLFNVGDKVTKKMSKHMSELTGIKEENWLISQDKKDQFQFSTVFLCLITGRLDYVTILLKHNQFNPVPFALLTCLICQRLLKGNFSEQVTKEIKNLKDECESLASEIVNRVSIRVRFDKKNILLKYIKMKNHILGNKNLLDIAFLAKCHKFISLPICQEAINEVWNKNKLSPKLKYWLHFILHLIFLGIFSYVVVSQLRNNVGSFEYACYVYALTYLFEEIHQLVSLVRFYNAKYYFYEASNILDIIALVLIIIGVIMRFTTPHFDYLVDKNPNLFIIRCVYCVSLLFFYMRLLYFLSCFEVFGPKLKMIGLMVVKDLIPLIVIFLVFITSFGVVCQAILFPNAVYVTKSISQYVKQRQQPLHVIADIFRRATFTIFDAHYTLEEVESHNNEFFIPLNSRIVIYFVLVFYIVVVNVMLMNLLIALFSYTVTCIIEESKYSWKAERYKFVKEYKYKSILPPPLNVFFIFIRICRIACKKRHKKKTNNLPVEVDSTPLTTCSTNTNNQETVETKIDKKSEKKAICIKSYSIIQAFALREQRQNLLASSKDSEYDIKIKINKINDLLQKLISNKDSTK